MLTTGGGPPSTCRRFDLGSLISYVAHGGYGLAAAVVVTAATVAAGWARSSGRSPLRATLLALSISAIPAATLLRTDDHPYLQWDALAHWAPSGLQRFASAAPSSAEIILNAALYVPAAIVVVAFRVLRPPACLVVLVALSSAIECIQGLLGLGVPDVADIASNTTGALVGTWLGCAYLITLQQTRRLEWRSEARWVAATTLIVAAFELSVPYLARSDLDRLADEARDRWGDMTLADYRRLEGRPDLNTKLFELGGIFSDGSRSTRAGVVVRFPATFLGIHQCVLVEWSSTGVNVTTERGADCSAVYL